MARLFDEPELKTLAERLKDQKKNQKKALDRLRVSSPRRYAAALAEAGRGTRPAPETNLALGRRTQPPDGSPADLHSSDGQPCTIVLNPPKAIRPGTNGMSGGIVDFFISAITRLLTAFRWAFDL